MNEIRGMGHSLYTPELAAEICERLAKGESLLSICRSEHMPAESTVRRWEVDHPDFGASSTRAREAGCHRLAEECLEIADDGSNDWMRSNKPDDPGFVLNGEHVQRSKLRIETRMRLIGKWLPRVYGDKQQIEHSGAVDVTSTLSSARRRSGLA